MSPEVGCPCPPACIDTVTHVTYSVLRGCLGCLWYAGDKLYQTRMYSGKLPLILSLNSEDMVVPAVLACICTMVNILQLTFIHGSNLPLEHPYLPSMMAYLEVHDGIP